jgi:hypothetical protein
VHIVHLEPAPGAGISSQRRCFNVRRVSPYPLCQCSRIEVPEKS